MGSNPTPGTVRWQAYDTNVRSYREYEEVMRLVARGLNDREVSRESGVPRGTVRDWRRGRVASFVDPSRSSCPVCAGNPDAIPALAYAYLLGQYLGDGYISLGPRGVYCLRVFCCSDYVRVIREVASAMQEVRPASRVGHLAHRRHRLVILSSYAKHWGCLFPQHGPGRKHGRTIMLDDWQQAIVDQHPEQLLRGLVHSDGWRGTNRVTVRGKTYEYPRYQFSNVSDDIRGIFCDACDAVGVEWRRMNATNISVARRESVALLDEFIGPKS